MAGIIHYICGHEVHDPDAPQDQDWQSEVGCPCCRFERGLRVLVLQFERGMTARAATTVVDAAMYGIGCIEGEVRARIERERIEREKETNAG